MGQTRNAKSVRKRYDRLARFYDRLEAPMERLRFASWRQRLRDKIVGERALEVGVGTGKNLAYYPADMEITAIDFSPRMLQKARKKASTMRLDVEILEMDVEDLRFPDRFFDTIFATFVFCSVPDPVKGLQEMRRVCKPDGRLLLMEHMRPGTRIRGLLFDLLNPLVMRTVGANINRKTLENIETAGWRMQVDEHLASDVVHWIEAAP